MLIAVAAAQGKTPGPVSKDHECVPVTASGFSIRLTLLKKKLEPSSSLFIKRLLPCGSAGNRGVVERFPGQSSSPSARNVLSCGCSPGSSGSRSTSDCWRLLARKSR